MMTARVVGDGEPAVDQFWADIRSPWALLVTVARRHWPHATGQELDDMIADGALEMAVAAQSWDPNGGRGAVSWAWLAIKRGMHRGRLRRGETRVELTLDSDGTWLEPVMVDHRFSTVEDRVMLQRWADIAYLTDAQADALAWGAVHMHTPTRQLGGNARWFPEQTRSVHASWKNGIDRMRVAERRERARFEGRARRCDRCGVELPDRMRADARWCSARCGWSS
jgi:hypothetical protein